MEWIKGLLKRYKCQDHFDKAWKSVPSYHKLTKPNKPYRQVSQWQGKEMRSFSRIILATLAASLSCTWSTVYPQTAKQQADDENRKDVCVKALQCTWSLIDFHLYSQFKVHTNTTLNQLEKHWAEFHESKSVFLEFRHLKVVSKASKLAVKLLRDEHEVAAFQPFRDEKELLRGSLQTIQ